MRSFQRSLHVLHLTLFLLVSFPLVHSWQFVTKRSSFVVRHRRHCSRRRIHYHHRQYGPCCSDTTANTRLSVTALSASASPWSAQDKELLRRRYKPSLLLDHNNNQNMYDYIIVGSGIGGLWLAACLAQFNLTSLVLEQHDIAGGLQHSFTRQGYEFVPGIHYLANLELCAPLYEMVIDDESSADPLPPLKFHKCGATVPADQGQSHTLQVGNLPTLRVRTGLEAVRRELQQVFVDDKAAIDAFLVLTEKAKWQAGMFATFKIFPPWLQWILSQTLCASYISLASRSTREILNPLTTDGRLQTVLSAFGGDLGESIDDGSFVMQAAVLGHVYEGCWYPESGPMHLTRGLIPTIRRAGGDVLVKAPVQQILISPNHHNHYRAVGVQSENGDKIYAQRGVVSNAGVASTLRRLLSPHITNGPLRHLRDVVNDPHISGNEAISHVFLFVGLNASSQELQLQSSSFYYIPWNETNKDMDATVIQDYYRNTLLNPNVLDVSAGMVFCTAKDPVYAETVMPNKSTCVVFSEARVRDFEALLANTEQEEPILKSNKRPAAYREAKKLIERKMMRSLLLNFPQLTPYIDYVEVATPLTLDHYTRRPQTLGLRHTPERMTSMDIRPDCAVQGLYFTGQDVAFAGWAGALTGGMVTAQKLLNYTLLDFARGKTLMRDLGRGDHEDMIQSRVNEATKASPLEVLGVIWGNAVHHVAKTFQS